MTSRLQKSRNNKKTTCLKKMNIILEARKQGKDVYYMGCSQNGFHTIAVQPNRSSPDGKLNFSKIHNLTMTENNRECAMVYVFALEGMQRFEAKFTLKQWQTIINDKIAKEKDVWSEDALHKWQNVDIGTAKSMQQSFQIPKRLLDQLLAFESNT